MNHEGNHGHGDDLQCFALPDTQHAITLNVWLRAFISDPDKTRLLASIEAIIRAAFRETADYPSVTRTTPFGRFSFSQLTTELHELLPDVQSLSFEQADIISERAIPRLLSLTVNLHE